MNKAVVSAYNKGYRVINGEVISPFSGNPWVLKPDRQGYFRFNIANDNNSYIKEAVYVHKLAAYQKYGTLIFEKGVEVRHLDGDCTNNLSSNIDYGTALENAADKDSKVTKAAAIAASTHIRKFTDAEMDNIRRFHNGSYKETMEYFNISSKGILHRILNTEYETKV
jgi:hypothetical protein